jgi:hypothetical protein
MLDLYSGRQSTFLRMGSMWVRNVCYVKESRSNGRDEISAKGDSSVQFGILTNTSVSAKGVQHLVIRRAISPYFMGLWLALLRLSLTICKTVSRPLEYSHK